MPPARSQATRLLPHVMSIQPPVTRGNTSAVQSYWASCSAAATSSGEERTTLSTRVWMAAPDIGFTSMPDHLPAFFGEKCRVAHGFVECLP